MGFKWDSPAEMAEVIPVRQNGAQACDQPIDDVPRSVTIVQVAFGLYTAQGGRRRAQHVHRVRVRGQLLEHGTQRARYAAKTAEKLPIRDQLGAGGQPSMY